MIPRNNFATAMQEQPPALPPYTAVPVRPRSTLKTTLIVIGVVMGCVGIVAAAANWWVSRNLYASAQTPVTLTAAEVQDLQSKLDRLAAASHAAATPQVQVEQPAEAPAPERPVLKLSERDINGFLAQNGWGENVKVALTGGNIVANVLVPMDQDAVVLGGKTLRLKISLGARMGSDHRPILQLNDLSIGGIPLPNAWLGGIKGVNLLASEMNADPAAQNFASGVRGLKIDNGEISLELND